FLDYLIVIALAALVAPYYLSHALGWEGLRSGPWDVVAGSGVIVAVAAAWLVGQRRLLRRLARFAVVLALVSHLLLIVLGFALLAATSGLKSGTSIGSAPTWSALAFALPVAMLAFTGLETVANLAAETREPGRTLPRALFAGIGAAVAASVGMGFVGVFAFPAHPGPDGETTDLGTRWLRAPLVGIANAFGGHLSEGWVDALRIFIGVTGAIVLVAAVTTAIAGSGRLAFSLGQHDMLPHRFGTLSRRSRLPPPTIVSVAVISIALLVVTDIVGDTVRSLASLYSFGVLLTFTAAQLAVIRLRFREPDLERPFRVPGNISIRGREIPVAALVGAPLTFAIWIAVLGTHDAARIGGPVWMALGVAVFIAVRRASGEGLTERVKAPVADLVPHSEGAYQKILVPMKLGQIGEEVLATAIKLAEEEGARVDALYV